MTETGAPPAEVSAAKERLLRATVRALGRAIVAFSGGVDSTVVLGIAVQELGADALAITARSPSLPQAELDEALATARALGARHEVIDTAEVLDPDYAANPANRCYFCKRTLYDRLGALARERDAVVLDGFNHDDAADWRPGRKAALERGVRSPLAEAQLTKLEVRELARRLGLPAWDKPAMACLSSRVPYGTAITPELLQRIERAESALWAEGVRDCRVRHHGEIARIEVPLEHLSLLLEPARRERILANIRAAGYRYVAVDLAGYAPGEFNLPKAAPPEVGRSSRGTTPGTRSL